MSYRGGYSSSNYYSRRYSPDDSMSDSPISYSPKPRDRDRTNERMNEREWEMIRHNEWNGYSPRRGVRRDDPYLSPRRDIRREEPYLSPRREMRRDDPYLSPRREIRRDDPYLSPRRDIRREDECGMFSPRSRSEMRFREKRREEEQEAETYFNRNRRNEWFIKQFHPINLRERRMAKQRQVQEAYDRFMNNITFPNYGDEKSLPDDPYDGRRVMVISDHATTSERMKEIAPLKDQVEKVVIGDPRYRKVSVGFVVYKTKEAAAQAKTMQSESDRSQLSSIRSKEPQLRYAPRDFNEKERLDKDCVQLNQLIGLMDQINGVKGKALQDTPEWEHWNIREKVDVQITYLRKVHSLCYYCLIEYADEEELYRRCTIHYRESSIINQDSHLPPKTVHWFKNFDNYEYSFYTSLKEEDKALASEAQKRIVSKLFKEGVCNVCNQKVEDPVKHAFNCHSSKIDPVDIDEINERFKRNFLSDPKKKALPNY
ncbi:hypothetical protein conserved [Entamoeba histolytica]|uniref:DUF4187 domain-containing protein n=4 Tax=Entamoeba histolytica TaxID=5759 RepID=C4M822_ENTH1|nr:hypothetical protein, conserved [Entamoeba histolytica HM-1:IMSS]EAL43295.1 hypothetical protein, conserved [Entamoeba histolytica HM-1:IMSS]EMD45656.1 Hypothetical protein EHI5A_190610 [Entamoeba histolytica KU27]GAT97711.1 hypothetical protein conserved [Entamoeba histolytica]|eukprot:XP_648684.1 hypothetical protein, conserved [Entamoeba histolytica HM-1:IMSS]